MIDTETIDFQEAIQKMLERLRADIGETIVDWEGSTIQLT